MATRDKLEKKPQEADPTKQRITELEEEIRKTPYNKATQKHIGMLKAKLAQLQDKLTAEQARKSGKKGLGFGIRKTGDATVLLVGFPSVGKSTLLNALTNADSPVADYEFTTLTVIPGMMVYNGARIQMLDIPGIITGASTGKGRGKEILSMARAADLICLMLDASKDYENQAMIIKDELNKAGFRLNQRPPDIRFQKKTTGGISITFHRPTLDGEIIKEVLHQFGLLNAELVVPKNLAVDQLVDFVAGNRVYIPFVVIVNKTDVLKRVPAGRDDMIFISAKNHENINRLKEMIWDKLCFTRIYLKRIGKEPDMEEPLIMKGNPTVSEVSKAIHKEFHDKLSHARIWGPSSKFPGQRVGVEQRLRDGDIVELHMD
ncbi:MAG: GTP-binding protein [Candidatus Aenigmatarchaeota archaeon]